MKKILPFFTLIILFVGCSLTLTNNDDDISSNEYFSNPTPINNSTEQSTSVTLFWETDENFISYDIYFSRYSQPTTLIANNLTTKSHTKSDLSYETTYFGKLLDTMKIALQRKVRFGFFQHNTIGEAEIRVEDIENNLTKNILIHITN